MKKRFIFLLVINSIITISCGQIKKDTNMTERYNFEAIKDNPNGVSIEKDEWIIDISPMPGGLQKEYAPAKDFYMIQKTYHDNGMIESRGKLLGMVPFGNWEFFDENGKLLDSVDEDAKFGKIKPHDLVEIMEKVGWINRKKGEAITSDISLSTNGNYYKTLFVLSYDKNMNVRFITTPYPEDEINKSSTSVWVFDYLDGNMHIEYVVNGNTGEYKKYEKEIQIIE